MKRSVSKRVVKKGKKIKSISKLKKEAWDAFSRMIRLKYADNNGYVGCVTCGVGKHWKESQAGHFLDGRHNSVLFDERNVHPQCVKCNMFMSGNKIKYYEFMRIKYGQETIDELEFLDTKDKKFTREELIDMCNKYKIEAEKIMKEGMNDIGSEIPY
jgi:hypothetical protein